MKKKCYGCKQIKELNCFYVDKSKKDDLTNLCRSCYKEKYKLEREKRLAYKKKYAETHKEEISNYFKEYHKKHKKPTIKECAKCKNPFEVFKEGGNKYCNECQIKMRQKSDNIKTCIICSATFESFQHNTLYCKHCRVIKKREKERKNTATFRKIHPEKIKESSAKRRNLGFNPINSPFPNSEGHHLDISTVMFIPRDIHHSVFHNVFTGKNMNIINCLAWKWYFENEL